MTPLIQLIAFLARTGAEFKLDPVGDEWSGWLEWGPPYFRPAGYVAAHAETVQQVIVDLMRQVDGL